MGFPTTAPGLSRANPGCRLRCRKPSGIYRLACVPTPRAPSGQVRSLQQPDGPAGGPRSMLGRVWLTAVFRRKWPACSGASSAKKRGWARFVQGAPRHSSGRAHQHGRRLPTSDPSRAQMAVTVCSFAHYGPVGRHGPGASRNRHECAPRGAQGTSSLVSLSNVSRARQGGKGSLAAFPQSTPEGDSHLAGASRPGQPWACSPTVEHREAPASHSREV